MADSGVLALQFSQRPAHPPTIFVGVTCQETCRAWGARLRALRLAGFRVFLVCGPGEFADNAASLAGVGRIVVPMRRSISPIADLASLLRLLWLMARRRPDVVEFSTPKAGLLGMLAAKLCGIRRRVYFMRGLKLECSTGFKRAILLATERLACACASNILCNSNSLRTEALVLRIAPARKMHVLDQGSSIGVDVNHFSPGPSNVRERLRIPNDAPLVGFVGRFTRDKGLPELIDAFDRILVAEPATRLLLVGWFDDAEDAVDRELRARILDNRRIHCTGYVGDTAPYYRAMDVMVLPTWREGLPNAVLEASASAVPVVTTESTGARDSVVAEVTGLLVPPGYPVAISEAVIKLLSDPRRRERMGRSARAWVTEHFSESRILSLTANYYIGLFISTPVADLQHA